MIDNIIELSIEKISPYDNNAKIHTEDQIDAVVASIRQFGIVQPIVVDEDHTIIIGHCRYEAARRIGLKTFPCVVAKLPKEQANALRIIDNKTNESEWDYELLNDQIKELKEIIDMTELGFSIADVIQVEDVFPDDLDFDNEMYYVENAESQLKSSQVTIYYETEREESWIKSILNVEKLNVCCMAETILAQKTTT